MWLRLASFAELYDVHPDTVRSWIRKNRVKYKRIERTLFLWEEQEAAAIVAVLTIRRTNGNGHNGNGHARKR